MSCSIEQIIKIGARGSTLSKCQVQEVLDELRLHHPHIDFESIYIKTWGDLDRKTSLRKLDKTDFFTREIDQSQLRGEFRISIHSAKDLPEPLADGLELIALTKGVDPFDSLVIRDGETFASLPKGAKIATSSFRREESVRHLRQDFIYIDVRGTIEERLELLQKKEADGVVVAEAALIRLKKMHLNRIFLPGAAASLQGQLAVIARKADSEMAELFQSIDVRRQWVKSRYFT